MSELFDTKTGERIEIDDPIEYANAINSGQYGFKKGSKLRVYNPDNDDDAFEIPAKNAKEALKEGYLVETGKQRAIREAVEENKGLLGGLKVGGYELLNELAFSIPEIIFRNTGDPLDVAKWDAIRDEHKMSSAVGTTLGIGANIYGLAKTGVAKGIEEASEQLVNGVSKKIMAKYGSKKITEEAAKGLAKSIVSRIGTGLGKVGKNAAIGAVEGGLSALPQVVTEAALGDGETAAETLLISSGAGGVLSAGLRSIFQGADSVTKTLTNDEFARGAYNRVEPFQDSALQKVARSVSRAWTNVDENDLLWGLQNRQAIKNAPTMEANLDQVSKALDDIRLTTEAKKEAYQEASNRLAATERQAIDEMRAKSVAPNAEVANEFLAMFQDAKRIAYARRAEADEILKRDVPRIHSKIAVINDMRDSVKRIKPVGKGKEIINTIEQIADDVDSVYPDVLDGLEVNEIVRSVRDLTDYNPNVVGFDPKKNQILKDVSKKLDEKYVKSQSADYRRLMADNYQLAQAMEDIGDNVSNEVGALELAARLTSAKQSGKKIKLQKSVDDFIASYGKLSDQADLANKVDNLLSEAVTATEFVKDQKLARRGTPKDFDAFLEKNFPENYQARNLAKAELDEALAEMDRFKPLMSGPLEKKLMQMGHNVDNIELKRAFEALGKKIGNPSLSDQIYARAVRDKMMQARPQGSRMANLMGSMGLLGGVSGSVTIPVLAASGLMLDYYGGRVIKNILDSDGSLAAGIRGLLMTTDEMKKVGTKVDNIPGKIRSFIDVQKKAKASTTSIAIQASQRMWSNVLEADRKARQEAGEKQKQRDKAEVGKEQGRLEQRRKGFEAFMNNFQRQTSDNAKMREEMGFLAAQGAPSISMIYQAKVMAAQKYLYDAAPKNPIPDSPFAKKTKWVPSDYDLSVFEEKALVVSDPFVVVDLLASNELTRNHIDALQKIYPDMYRRIVGQVVETLSSEEVELSYADRVSLSYVLDSPLDQSLSPTSYAFFQKRSKTSDEQVDIENNMAINESFKANINIDTDTIKTTAQRLESRA